MNGDLSKTPFPKVLWETYRSKQTGLLEIKKKESLKKIYLEEGQPISAESNLLHETLGKFLLSEKVITSEQEQKALVLSLEGRKPFAETLVAIGAIQAAHLYEQMKKNFALKIQDCFSWESGFYSFLSGKEHLDSIPNFKMNAVRLILWGAESVYPLTRILSEGMTDSKVYRVVPNAPIDVEVLKLNADEINVLNSVQTPKSIPEIALELKFDKDHVRRKLYAFSVMGLVSESAGKSGEISLDELVTKALLQGLKPIEPKKSVNEADQETLTLANEIAADHMKLLGSNYFELLNLPESATAVQIRDRFIEFSSKYNPGRFRSSSLGEFRDKGEEVYLKGVKAYATLSEFESKTKYLDKIKADRKKTSNGGKKNPADYFKIQTKLLDAGPQFEQGVHFLKEKKFAKAIEYFQYAVDIDSKHPSYLAHVGWATFLHAPERNQKEAEGILKRALELGTDAYASFYWGKFLAETGRMGEAVEHLKRAAEIDPKNIDFVREARNIEKKK